MPALTMSPFPYLSGPDALTLESVLDFASRRGDDGRVVTTDASIAHSYKTALLDLGMILRRGGVVLSIDALEPREVAIADEAALDGRRGVTVRCRMTLRQRLLCEDFLPDLVAGEILDAIADATGLRPEEGYEEDLIATLTALALALENERAAGKSMKRADSVLLVAAMGRSLN